ncbi:5-oxoprolinase subunit PxpA [Pikeienuella piscinae]|uniref:5-oxoprolinase subunit A n=1 Tax=Pikeienuella piscinae TaxID=2748098 RepID=A0A7L5BZ61_9RHOB|nr:5-oxoprolinase subunit PxpA [Pikeienuella piscinae]QIE56761.1 5-oxoprolinase subunit PxpA [Pikeienuella piscinae]
MRKVDLNADMGESWGAWKMGHDAEMFEVITSANVACGFHGGDPLVMHETLRLAREKGVGVGAHPGYLDLWGFGRRRFEGDDPIEIEKLLIYQVGALQGMAKAVGVPVTHFKAHGALANLTAVDADMADATARAVLATDPDMIFVALPGTEQERAAARAGLRIAREAYADRAYAADGTLAPRKTPGAVLDDPETAARRAVRMATEGRVATIDGREIALEFDTICVHGDNLHAVEMARAVRGALTEAGVAIRPMAETAEQGAG